MAKKVKPGSHDIRSALPLGQKREFKNAIRTQSEQLLILKKVRYLDGGDDNLPIPMEGSDLPDRGGPTSRELGWADGGLSGFFDAVVDDGTSERTDGPDPADQSSWRILMEEVIMAKNVGSTGALIHYKKDGFLAMANAGRIFPDLHYSNKDYIPVSFHEFKRHSKWSDLHCLIGLHKNHDCVYTRLQDGSVIHSTLMSPTQFEAHSDEAQRRKPYKYICTEGVSLHELVVRLSKTRELSNAENDNLCNICPYGGDLLCCDLCPRAFHLACLDLSSTPDGKWHCPSCLKTHQKEKYMEHNGNARADRRVPGVDPIEERLKQHVPIVKTPEIDVGGCVLCRKHDCSTSGFGPRTILICAQELPEAKWFCSSDCNAIYNTLHDLMLQGAQPVPNIALDIVNCKWKMQDLMTYSSIELKWRLLSDNMEGDEKDIRLAKALSIFHESFDPIVDPVTNVDLMPPMVFGSKFSEEQGYKGMYCAILTEGSCVIMVVLLIVLGIEVEEVPLVATRTKDKGLGYFQALFSCIERLLMLLKVKHLLLHAAEEAESIWKIKFGFTNITSSQLQDYAKGVKLQPVWAKTYQN